MDWYKLLKLFIVCAGILAMSVLGVQYLLGGHVAEYIAQKGNYYFAGGTYDLGKAETWYRRALWLDPHAFEVRYRLADTLFIQGDFAEALKEINQVVDEAPDFARAYYVRGLIRGWMGGVDLDAAEEDFKKALSLRKDDIVNGIDTRWAIYNDLAWIQFQKGEYAEVEETTRAGLEKFPENPWLLNSLGLALMNLEKKQEAKDVFDKAIAAVEKLTLEDVRRAYPGNNPVEDKGLLDRIRTNIKFNKTLAVDN